MGGLFLNPCVLASIHSRGFFEAAAAAGGLGGGFSGGSRQGSRGEWCCREFYLTAGFLLVMFVSGSLASSLMAGAFCSFWLFG